MSGYDPANDDNIDPAWEVDAMTVVTVAGPNDANALMLMISHIRRTSGNIPIIIFDHGLSDHNKAKIQKQFACAIKETPKAINGSCKSPCKPRLITSVVAKYKIIVWMDVGYLPAWDLRQVLDGAAVGTSFVGFHSDRLIPSAKEGVDARDIKALSLEFFIVFVELRFYNRVLLPWKFFAEDQNRQFIAVLLKHGGVSPEMLGTDPDQDFILTALLRSYEALYAGSVVTNASKDESPFPLRGPNPDQYEQGLYAFFHRVSNRSTMPREPFLAAVPLFGPNNQLAMVLHSANVAATLGVRFLAPPLQPHRVKVSRQNVSQDSPTVPAEHLLSAHFLYRRAVLATESSSWAALLPTVDFIIAEIDPRSPSRSRLFPPWRPCVYSGKCKVGDLMNNKYVAAYFLPVGLEREKNSSINTVMCPKNPQECIRSSIVDRRRIAMIVWSTIAMIGKQRENISELLFGPFSVNPHILERGFSHERPCMAVHLRLKDQTDRGDLSLINSPVKEILYRNSFENRTVAETIQLFWRVASRRGVRNLNKAIPAILNSRLLTYIVV